MVIILILLQAFVLGAALYEAIILPTIQKNKTNKWVFKHFYCNLLLIFLGTVSLGTSISELFSGYVDFNSVAPYVLTQVAIYICMKDKVVWEIKRPAKNDKVDVKNDKGDVKNY